MVARPGGGARRPGRAGPAPGGGDRPGRRGRRGRAALPGLAEPWKSGSEASRASLHAQLARSRSVAAREAWKPPVPGALSEEERRGTACSLPLSGRLGQFARAALGNLLIGKLGRETNANVLEELRVTSLGAEALFSFPAPCPTSARLGQRRMCHQLGALGGIPGPAGCGSTWNKGKRRPGRPQPSPAAALGPPGGSHCCADPRRLFGGVSPGGPLDGNQLDGLGVNVASELACSHYSQSSDSGKA